MYSSKMLTFTASISFLLLLSAGAVVNNLLNLTVLIEMTSYLTDASDPSQS